MACRRPPASASAWIAWSCCSRTAHRSATSFFSHCSASTASSAAPNTIRAVVEYDGTEFSGFQIQTAQRTVAGELERALGALMGETIKVSAAGRTDAGVHATGQVISFTARRIFPFDRLARALTSMLPHDIVVRDAEVVERSFSARFSALERTYVYVVFNSSAPSALLRRYACHMHGPLDLERMRAGASFLIGEHDFRSFCGIIPESGVTVRTVKRIDVVQRPGLMLLSIAADGFLHRMVRAIVGTLLEVAANRRDAGDVPHILAARDRQASGPTAPAHGLYLAGARYSDFDSFKEPPWVL